MARNGGRIAMLADLQDRRGAVIPFFGRDAYATLFPASIACAAQVPLIACRVVRLPHSRFRIEARVVEFERTGDRRSDAAYTGSSKSGETRRIGACRVELLVKTGEFGFRRRVRRCSRRVRLSWRPLRYHPLAPLLPPDLQVWL